MPGADNRKLEMKMSRRLHHMTTSSLWYHKGPKYKPCPLPMHAKQVRVIFRR